MATLERQVLIRLSPNDEDDLKAWAKNEDRKRSNLAGLLLRWAMARYRETNGWSTLRGVSADAVAAPDFSQRA